MTTPTYTFDEFRKRQDECAKYGVSMYGGNQPAYAAFGEMTAEIDKKVKKERASIRWFCPECHRVDPRHPMTTPDELPKSHNRPETVGMMYWDESRFCKGQRIAQRFNEEKQEWVNE